MHAMLCATMANGGNGSVRKSTSKPKHSLDCRWQIWAPRRAFSQHTTLTLIHTYSYMYGLVIRNVIAKCFCYNCFVRLPRNFNGDAEINVFFLRWIFISLRFFIVCVGKRVAQCVFTQHVSGFSGALAGLWFAY